MTVIIRATSYQKPQMPEDSKIISSKVSNIDPDFSTWQKDPVRMKAKYRLNY